MISTEALYLLVVDLQRDLRLLTVRHDAMEKFIKDQYPQYFAGEAGTIADPALAPVDLTPRSDEIRADPTTCPHPKERRVRRDVVWQKGGAEFCEDCGKLMENSDGPR